VLVAPGFLLLVSSQLAPGPSAFPGLALVRAFFRLLLVNIFRLLLVDI
jgi:hypothetical protein